MSASPQSTEKLLRAKVGTEAPAQEPKGPQEPLAHEKPLEVGQTFHFLLERWTLTPRVYTDVRLDCGVAL